MYSTWVGTWLGLYTTGISGSVRLLSGRGRLLECYGPDLLRPNKLICQNSYKRNTDNQ